jgi:S1-C subfamily serine protease
MALSVTFVGQYGKHAAGKGAGFKKDDIIVKADGRSVRMTEGELIGYLLQKHDSGERIKATVLRSEARLELALPIQ